MSITNELREWMRSLYTPNSPELKLNGLIIADRIDENAKDNERFRREAEPFCKRLREASSERADVTLFGVDYIALPVDADGVPIRVGDVLEANRGTVTCIREAGHGWEIVTDHAYSYNPADLRHYHKPTVKDVLQELVVDWDCASDGEDKDAVLKEYADKLRLASDGKEQQ